MKPTLAVIVALLAMLACNLPAGSNAPGPDLLGTITAQALTLDAPQPSSTPTNQAASPVATGAASSTPAAPAPYVTRTPKPTKPPKPTKTPEPSATPADTWSTDRLDPAHSPDASASRQCEQFFKAIAPWWKETITLGWQDKIDGESGYWVTIGSSLVELPANSTGYTATLTYVYSDGSPKEDEIRIAAFRGDNPNREGQVATVLKVARCP